MWSVLKMSNALLVLHEVHSNVWIYTRASHWPIHFPDILCTEIILQTNTNYLAFCHVWIRSITAHLLSAHEKRQTNALALSFNACAMDSAQPCGLRKLETSKSQSQALDLSICTYWPIIKSSDSWVDISQQQQQQQQQNPLYSSKRFLHKNKMCFKYTKENVLHIWNNLVGLNMLYLWGFQEATENNLLTGGSWQKWKRVFLTCPCHKIYRDEAVGLKSCKYTWKITKFVKMGNLGQYRENLIFCQ